MNFIFIATLNLILIFCAQGRLIKLEESSGNNLKSADPKGATCQNTPSPKTKVNFPDSLAGRSIAKDLDMYTGYINISSSPDYLFYWFFPSLDNNPNAPLIVWTNGGPGCSSMEGATTENGPLVLLNIKESCSSSDCDFTQQLSTNPYGWNNKANILYLDQPRYVGFSFGNGDYAKSSVEAASDFVTFLNNWYVEFPEFVSRKVIISGESYGGHYIPAMGDAVMNYNANLPVNNQVPIQLSGLIIGNGCVNNTVQDDKKYIEFLHDNNLIPDDAAPRNQLTADAMMVKHIGYVPNYYDYRSESITCSACFGYNYTAWSDWLMRDDVKEALGVCGNSGNDAFGQSSGGCITIPGFDQGDDFDYSGAVARALNSGIPVTFYYGKTDTACNYVGGYAMASTISWKGTEGFVNTEFTSLNIAGANAGQIKSFSGLTFIQVESAGHMVPLDQPVAAFEALNSILNQI